MRLVDTGLPPGEALAKNHQKTHLQTKREKLKDTSIFYARRGINPLQS